MMSRVLYVVCGCSLRLASAIFGAFKARTEDQYTELKSTWDRMQRDLASRSKYGELRIAEQSGHYIHVDQPELVVRAIRDVLKRAGV